MMLLLVLDVSSYHVDIVRGNRKCPVPILPAEMTIADAVPVDLK
jgi:hypothetical protein